MKTLRYLCTLLAITLPAHAQNEPSNWQWHGFASQGIIQAQDSNFINDDGDVSLQQTELGINASYRFSSRSRVSGQVVYINGGNRYPEGVRIDYLFWDISLVNTLDWRVNLYLGRNKNLQWLYSTDRTLPHVRPSIIPAQSIYFDVFRDVALASDGAALSVQTSNDWGDWEFQARIGTSPISRHQMLNLLSREATGDLDQDTDRHISLDWQPAGSNLELGVTMLDSKFSYTAGQNDGVFDGNARSSRLQFSARYSAEKWELASEVAKERVEFENVLFPGFYNKAIAEGGYVQYRYFWNDDLTLLTRLDLLDRDREDRKGEFIEALTNGAVPGYFGFMDTLTVGASWDIKNNWRLNAEYHRVKGTGRLAPVLSADTVSNDRKYWDIWAVELIYWF